MSLVVVVVSIACLFSGCDLTNEGCGLVVHFVLACTRGVALVVICVFFGLF